MLQNMLEIKDNKLFFRMDGETLCVQSWGKDAFRVRASMMQKPQDTDYALLPPEHADTQGKVETPLRGSITNGKITAVAEIDSYSHHCKLKFLDSRGRILLEETGHGGALRRPSRKFTPLAGDCYQLEVRFSANPDEHFYGMGQYQQEILDLKHCKLELAQRNTQASIPFVMSSLGYGFLWHDPSVGSVTFGKNATEWSSKNTRQMDYWICAGDTPDEIMQKYTLATGRPPMMPEYGLGFWQCKLRYWNQEQLLNVAREYHRRGIPVDVIVCDFYHWPNTGDFRFEEELFPDPSTMVRELDEMGMKLMVSVWPQVATSSENYREMQQKGLLVKTVGGLERTTDMFHETGTFFDATNPEARQYVWDKCKSNYFSHGIQLFWLDEAEPDFSVYDHEQFRYYLGAALQVTNLYPQLFSKTFYDGLIAEGNKNIINLVRCAWAGSQRYGALLWSGDIHCDWETFRKQICAGLNAGMAGIPWWTTDIGGFSGGDPTNAEFQQLLVRWFQWGAFCPVMRLHGDRQPTEIPTRSDGTKLLFTGGDNEIWSFGEDNYPILKKYILFREDMRPYIREVMKEAHSFGRPVMRPMFYEFPDDRDCWTLQDQYMFGSDVLVAPIVYKDTWERQVYLPKGAKWTELHSGIGYDGGQTVRCAAPLEQIPVFLRDNTHSDWIGKI